MNKKIFRSTCIVAFFVFLVSLALIMGVLYQYFGRQLNRELENEAVYLAHALENEGAAYFEGLPNMDKRITLVAGDGEVLYDTDADAASMENHLAREEIQEALASGTGSSSRYSKTLTQATTYYALRLSDGSVLRVATTQYTVLTLLFGILQPLLLVAVFALILSAVLASRVSRAIITPINAIDLEHPEENVTYDELSPLLSRIAHQNRTIAAQLQDARKRQEEFRLLTDNMSEGFLVIDHNTNLLSYNAAALTLLGSGHAGGASVLTLNRSEGFRDTVSRALEGLHAEGVIQQAGRCLQLIANPVFDGEEAAGAILVILDITEKTQREQLRREFSANVSHELKTPLTSISGFAELMMSGAVKPADITDFSRSIYQEAQRLITLVGDIIRLSELDEKDGRYEREDVDLYALAQQTAARLQDTATRKKVEISVTGAPAVVSGVRHILEEMLYNLADNAVKYNKESGRVDILVSQSAQDTRVIVRDTGIGIPKAEQARVFERFYRVDKSHSKEIGGTGLGLSIVKHGAAYHNAEIILESTPGQGTNVTLIFPKETQK